MNDDYQIGFLLYVGIFLAYTYWPSTNVTWLDKVWFMARYGVSYERVYMSKRPIDCDFMSAPIGKKGCSYSSRVIVNSGGNNIEVVWDKSD